MRQKAVTHLVAGYILMIGIIIMVTETIIQNNIDGNNLNPRIFFGRV